MTVGDLYRRDAYPCLPLAKQVSLMSMELIGAMLGGGVLVTGHPEI